MNLSLIEACSCTERITSAKSLAQLSTCLFFGQELCGMESVTINSSIGEFSIFSTALPRSIA